MKIGHLCAGLIMSLFGVGLIGLFIYDVIQYAAVIWPGLLVGSLGICTLVHADTKH